jgi:heat-inducible transcriptional repressor
VLDERKAAILQAVVTAYIGTAQPVGSNHVASSAGVNVSAATVRNEMVALERDGYLHQPHTSAGRIPTDKGYRFFVDQLSGPGVLEASQRQQVRHFFARAHGELEQMLADTSNLLSRLTDYAALVVGPPHEPSTIRAAQLVSLGPRLALVVLVFSNGAVERSSIELPVDTSEDAVTRASDRLAANLVGRTLASLPKPSRTDDRELDRVVAAGLSTLRSDDPEHVFIGGTSRMVGSFEAIETVRAVLKVLEQQFIVVTLLREVVDRGLSVAIGAEHGVESLADCAVVVAPFGVDGEELGKVGVLGPTRMDYAHAMASVAVVSQRLGRHLSEG